MELKVGETVEAQASQERPLYRNQQKGPKGPKGARAVFGYAVLLAENGMKHPDAKPLTGFGGAGVLEVVEDLDGDTYRAIYTVKFGSMVYILHAFKKKSKVGHKTPPRDMELITKRFREAEEHYKKTSAPKKK